MDEPRPPSALPGHWLCRLFGHGGLSYITKSEPTSTGGTCSWISSATCDCGRVQSKVRFIYPKTYTRKVLPDFALDEPEDEALPTLMTMREMRSLESQPDWCDIEDFMAHVGAEKYTDDWPVLVYNPDAHAGSICACKMPEEPGFHSRSTCSWNEED